MHFLPAAFVAAASLVAATRASETFLDRPGLAVRSDLMSCEETYGGGWTPCGDEVAPTQNFEMSMRLRG
jgi:hypothetical protein